MFNRKSQSSALIVAIVALIASLGGTAIAAKLITGKQIANGSVTGKDIKNKSLTKKDFKGSIRGAKGDTGPAGTDGVQGPAGTPNGYTKTEADAAFLGKTAKAADAEKLDNVDGDDYVSGDAALGWNAATAADNSAEFKLVDIGDIGELRATCGDTEMSLEIGNSSGTTLSYTAATVEDGALPDVMQASVAAEGPSLQPPSSATNYQSTLQISRPGANSFASADFTTIIVTATRSNGASACRFHAQTIDNEKDGTSLVIDG